LRDQKIAISQVSQMGVVHIAESENLDLTKGKCLNAFHLLHSQCQERY